MKIAVSSIGKTLTSPVDPRFGRAAYLLIIDADTGAIVEAIDNREAGEALQGAGIEAASRIAEAGVEAVLTGIVGPKAAAVCEKAGIAMMNGIEGSVAEAVEHFRSNLPLSRDSEPARENPRPPGQGACRGGQGKSAGKGNRQGGFCVRQGRP